MKKFKKEFENSRVSVGGQLITKENLTDDLYAIAVKADKKLAEMFEDSGSTPKKDVPA